MTEQLSLTFEQVYSTYYQRVYQRLYALLRNAQDAEDVTQETFLKAHRHFALLDSANVNAWLYRVATNAAYDVLRRRQLKTFVSLDTDEGDTLHPMSDDDVQEECATREALTTALAQMRPKHRAVLVLHYLEGQSLEEIAHVSGRGRDAAKSLTYRARQDFKQCYHAAGNAS